MIIHSKALSSEELIAFAKEVPGFVLINRFIPEIAERYIAFDNFKGAFLISHSRKISPISILTIRMMMPLDVNKVTYHQLPSSDNYIVEKESNDEAGKTEMIELLSKNNPITAIVTYNDFVVGNALAAIEE